MEQMLLISLLALWTLVILNLLLTLGLTRRVNTNFPKKKRLKLGQDAPDFTAHTLQGQTLHLADFTGRILTLIFFSPDCTTCQEILSGLKQLTRNVTQEGVELVLVGDHEADSLHSYTQKLDIDLPVLIAPPHQNSLLKDFKVLGVPWYCVIDEHGKIQAANFGLLEDIERTILRIQRKEAHVEGY